MIYRELFSNVANHLFIQSAKSLLLMVLDPIFLPLQAGFGFIDVSLFSSFYLLNFG
jgi:hypothetical protein